MEKSSRKAILITLRKKQTKYLENEPKLGP